MHNIIIAFAGRKQSGKTTSAEFVSQLYHHTHKVKIYNFADPLKQDLCMNVLGLTQDQCYGDDKYKNEKVNCYWPNTNTQMTAREVMQYIGTDIFRKIQKNVWADATINKIKKECYDVALIADCRFPNEVEVIKSAGGIVIKLMRDIYHSDHDSEIALDTDRYDYRNFDLVIDNTKCYIDEQNNIIKQFLSDKGILPL